MNNVIDTKLSVCVAILFFEKVDQTIECVQSFLPSGVPIYILNNNSSSESTATLKSFCVKYPQVTVFDSPENLGVSGGRNYLINHTKEKWMFFVDNDITITTDNWISKLQTHIQTHPDVDAFIPRLFNLHDQRYSTPASFIVKNKKVKRGQLDPTGLCNTFPGGASIVRRELFERLGLFDPGMFVGFEDFELTLRALHSGKSIIAKCVDDIDLTHDHRTAVSEIDRQSAKVRYDLKTNEQSYYLLTRKYDIQLEQNWKDWIKNQEDFIVSGNKRSSSDPMKVCFILQKAYPLFNTACKETFGGAEVQLYQIAKEMAKDSKFEVSFIVGDYGQRKVEKYGNIKVVKAHNIMKRRIRYFTLLYHNVTYFWTLSRRNSDAYVQMCAGYTTGLVALLCKLLRKKFIYMSASLVDVDGSYRKKDPYGDRPMNSDLDVHRLSLLKQGAPGVTYEKL